MCEYKKNKFIEQQKRDLFKTEKCKEIGIILIIISYKDCKKLNEESYKVIIKKKILEKNPEFDINLFKNDKSNFNDISSIKKLNKKFRDELEKEGYKVLDSSKKITHYRDKVIVICNGNNFTKTYHQYTTYYDNFVNRKCKFCHSPNPEDFEKAFCKKIKDVKLISTQKKNDKYFQYTCTFCEETPILLCQRYGF